MHVLWLGTKLPWPPVDGGRLVAWLTLEALAARGHRVTVVAPEKDAPRVAAARRALEGIGGRLEAVSVGARPRWLDAVAMPWSRRPWTLRRHAHGALRRRVAELVSGPDAGFDLVHVEQVQALDAASPVLGKLPLVLRAQNVESDLWRALAARRPLLGPLLGREARFLARREAEAARIATRLVTLTAEDASRFEEMTGGEVTREGGRLRVVKAPFPGSLPAGLGSLRGEPPLVLFGSAGWWPNRDGARWLLEEVWPRLHRDVPGAVLHLFGFEGPRTGDVEHHPAPEESADALPEGAVLLVPLFVASGVRMKILEAWARGVPTIASEAAARGLAATSGEHLLVAGSVESWIEAVLASERERSRLVEAGRAKLAEHAPAEIAARLEEIYAGAVSAGPARSS